MKKLIVVKKHIYGCNDVPFGDRVITKQRGCRF